MAGLLIFSSCATYPSYEFPVDQIDQFPEYVGQDGSYISPKSVDFSIPDVDILALNDEMKSLLDNSIVGIKSPFRRLKALVEIISEKVKYDTKDDKFGTKTAAETFESGRGNCLSYVNLLVAMARYAGLRCGYQNIETPPNWIRNEDVFFITRHVGAHVEFFTPVEYAYRIDFIDGKGVIVRDNRSRFLIAPSLDALWPEVVPYKTRSIPDTRAFAQYYNNIGSQFIAEGRIGDAYRYFIKAIKTDPELGFAWSNLGVAYTWNNQIDAAEKAYLYALSVNRGMDETSSMTIMSNLAKLYSRTGQKEQAARYEEKVISFRNRNPYYYFSMGKIAYDDGFFEDSVKNFKEAIRKKEDEPIFYYALALSYVGLDDIKNAEKSLKKAKSYAWERDMKDYYDKVLENLQNTMNIQKHGS